MNISAIQKLVGSYPVAQLKQAEEALLNEVTLPIEVEGEDEGEQLTHVLAAIWITEHMEQEQLDFRTALRAYTKKVRESIQ